MKLQNMAVIFAIIVIPMTLILSAYIGFQIDTASLQQSYDTKLLDATHDAVVAFQLNSIQNKYSTNADSLRRDVKASINAFFTSIATNLGVPGENSNYISQYIPAVVFTLYDGYYIYSPIETEYKDSSGITKTKYEHALKPYIPYSVRYKTENCDIVVNYSLDNYITIYGYMNGKYISRGGYLIAGDVADDGTQYRGVTITDKTAIQYYEAAKNFTYWIKSTTTDDGKKIGVNIVDVVKPKNALDAKGKEIKEFENDDRKILNVSDSNDPEDMESDFTAHKREVMKQSIQSNLNNAIWTYSNHSTLNTDFRMPILTEQDWDKVLSNVNVITFMQGLPVGIKEYNNYAIVTSTKNKQYVDPELLYYIYNGDYHKINCSILQEASGNITGYRSIDYDKQKDENGNYKYDHKEHSCYTCIVNSTTSAKKDIKDYKYNIKQAYYNTLARERWNLYKPTVTVQTDADVILDTVRPIVTSANSTTNTIKFTATDARTGIVGWTYTTTPNEPTTFTKCNNTKNLEKIIPNLVQNTWYYIWVIDASGNISEGKAVKTKPVPVSNENISFELSNNNWTNQDILVTAKSSTLEYMIQVSKDKSFPAGGTYENTIKMAGNGPVYARLIDSTGQSNGYATCNVTNIDKVRPQVTGMTATTNQVTITATDDASGIIGYAVTETSAIPSSFTACNNTKNFGKTVTGLKQNKTYYVWVKDQAGNINSPTSFRTRQVPASDGNIAFTLDPNGWTNGNVTVTATSKVEGYIVQVSKNTTFPNTATEVRSVTVSSNQTVYARLVDSTNQSNGYASIAVTKIDKTAPSVPNITYNGGDNTCSWKNNYNLNLSSTDSQSGVAYFQIDNNGDGNVDGTTGSNFIPGNGYNSCNVRFRAVDNVGNVSGWTAAQHIHMDTAGPGRTTVRYNSGANTCSWKNNYNISLSSSDNIGVAYYEIDWNRDGIADTTTGSNFIPWNGYSSCYTRFRSVDHAGNKGVWTEEHHIHMDTAAPGATTIRYNSGANTCSWKNNYNISLSSSDNIGVAYFEIDRDGNGTADSTTGSNFVPDNGYNSCSVKFRSVDHAGNRGAWTSAQHIHMDTEKPAKPTINLNGYTSGTWTSGNVTQTASSSDNIGISYYQYSHDGSNVATFPNPWTISWDGQWNFYVRAVDHAGNVSDWSDMYTIRRDATAPSKPTINLNGYTSGTWTSGNVTQTASATDNMGISYYQYSHDGSNVAGTFPNPWTINWDGQWNFFVRAVDYAGNAGAWSDMYTIRRDATAPSITTVTYAGGSNTCSWKNNYNINLSATDSQSGVSYYQIDTDGNGTPDTTTGSNFIPWDGYTSHNTKFRAVDYAGNVGAWSAGQHIHMRLHSHTEACKHYHTDACYTNNIRNTGNNTATVNNCPSCKTNNYWEQVHNWQCYGCNATWTSTTRYCHSCGYSNDSPASHSCANSKSLTCTYKNYASGAYVCGY